MSSDDDGRGDGDVTEPHLFFQPLHLLQAPHTPSPQDYEGIEMKTMDKEKSGLPETSYVEEKAFGGKRNVTTEEIETRRINKKKSKE